MTLLAKKVTKLTIIQKLRFRRQMWWIFYFRPIFGFGRMSICNFGFRIRPFCEVHSAAAECHCKCDITPRSDSCHYPGAQDNGNCIFTGRNAGIKITFVGLFWFLRPVKATLCTDYRQIWRGGGGGRHHLTQCQSWKFSGVILGIPAQKTLKNAKIT